MKYHRFIAFIVIILLVFQCKKDLELEPAVETGLVDSITAMTAVVHARIIDIGEVKILVDKENQKSYVPDQFQKEICT